MVHEVLGTSMVVVTFLAIFSSKSWFWSEKSALDHKSLYRWSSSHCGSAKVGADGYEDSGALMGVEVVNWLVVKRSAELSAAVLPAMRVWAVGVEGEGGVAAGRRQIASSNWGILRLLAKLTIYCSY